MALYGARSDLHSASIESDGRILYGVGHIVQLVPVPSDAPQQYDGGLLVTNRGYLIRHLLGASVLVINHDRYHGQV